MLDAEKSLLWNALTKLEAWIVKNEYASYDPFDGLSSYLRILTLGKKLPQQILQQFVRRNPFNLRPYIGIKPHTSTKGMGFLASGYLNLFVLTGDDQYRSKAEFCYDWLVEHSTKGFSGYCWGNSFDYISRGFYLAHGNPTVVWSALIGHHFLEAYRILKKEQYLDIAKSVGKFILADLPRVRTAKGVCISYITSKPVAVHNANLLGARFLAELFEETADEGSLDLATEAVRYSAASQLPCGAWYYGEEEHFHWIDNWHTAYNLDSLLGFQLSTKSNEFEKSMLKGLNFYTQHFFEIDGAPKYYWDRAYKYDIQSASQSIDTLSLFGRHLKRDDLLRQAGRIAGWTIAHMQDRTGYFYLWKNRWFTNKTPTFHWGGTTMFHALSHLLLITTLKDLEK
jgi:hypothetical protein